MDQYFFNHKIKINRKNSNKNKNYINMYIIVLKYDKLLINIAELCMPLVMMITN